MKRLRLLVSSVVLTTVFFSKAAHAADQSGGGMTGELFKVLLGLIAVLAMMAASAWLLKRFGVTKAAGAGTIKIVGGISVGNRERVLVVEVADQWIVVGVAPGRVNALATMSRQGQEQAGPVVSTLDAAPAASNFSAWLKQKMDKRNAN